MENPNHAISINQVKCWKKTGKGASQHLPITPSRLSSSTDSRDISLSRKVYDGFLSSKCTTFRPSLVAEAGRVREDVSNAPLSADTSRIEIRLLRETRSVFEYLCQHPSAFIFTDKGQLYSFPKIAVLRNIDQDSGLEVELNGDPRAGVIEFVLWMSMHQEPSKQQNEIRSNSRTGNIAIINKAMTLLVAESRSDGWSNEK